ncbi:MAG: hypothetical protein ACFFCS_28275 [Candidatus Hodarchaeota archaeon]
MVLLQKIAIITSASSNSMLQLMQHLSIPFEVFPEGIAMEKSADFNALAVIADQYPNLPSNLTELQSLVLAFKDAGKPVFCEFLPLEGLLAPEITSKEYTRLISRTTNNIILDGIDELSLFETHQNPFLIADKTPSDTIIEHLSFGRVAGVYNAIYGLPSKMFLGLGQQGSLLFSSIKLSDFDRMEFRLKIKFCQLVMNICKFLCDEWYPLELSSFTNPFDNRNYMESMKNLEDDARREKYLHAVVKGLDWFDNAGMFPKPMGVGGVYEGFTSGFDPEAKKSYRFIDELGFKVQRADCTADVATPFFLASRLHPEGSLTPQKRAKYEEISENIFNELYKYWQYYPDDKSISRGFFGWANSPYDVRVHYSDDNGRATMESLLHAYVKKDRDLFQRAFAAVNALSSTVGKNGHRWSRIDLKHFYEKDGRKWFSTHKVKRWKYHSAHYDAWTFAAVVYGGLLIEELPIIDLIERGISDYMKKFPDVHVEHSVGDDFSKLLVASVMLYQASKKDKHLKYVQAIIDFFAPYQDEYSGAFPEIDPFGKHSRTEPKNERYGTGESALYFEPTDTISDQLYSLGFLAMGLYFAHKTGKIPEAEGMLVRLLDYLCMIQLKSTNPQLDGAWTRGFDYRYGEPYGANGDVGWGAYSIETGWAIGSILTSLLMYLLDLDPFVPLDTAVQERVREDYYKEKKIQEGLELTWKEHTPKPIKHFTHMNKDEIEESLKGFKCNSIDFK